MVRHSIERNTWSAGNREFEEDQTVVDEQQTVYPFCQIITRTKIEKYQYEPVPLNRTKELEKVDEQDKDQTNPDEGSDEISEGTGNVTVQNPTPVTNSGGESNVVTEAKITEKKELIEKENSVLEVDDDTDFETATTFDLYEFMQDQESNETTDGDSTNSESL